MSPLSWEEVYADWQEDSGNSENGNQYYWRQHENPVHPTITKYMETAFDEAVGLARSGDDRAVLHLQRLAKRNNQTEQSVRAAEVLKELEGSR
jgi:hypothetical protein